MPAVRGLAPRKPACDQPQGFGAERDPDVSEPSLGFTAWGKKGSSAR